MYRLLLKAELRRRGRSWLAVALIGGLAGGFVLVAAAGARRTASTYTRFQQATLSPDFFFTPPRDADPTAVDELRKTKGVTAAVGFAYFPVVPDKPGIEPFQNAGAFGGFSPQFGVDVYRYRVLAGRRANERRADEVTVNPELADLAHLRVGDRIRLKSVIDIGRPTVTVVGIQRGEFDIGPTVASPSMLLTAAFIDRHLAAFSAASDDLQPVYLVRVDHDDPGASARAKAKTKALYGATLDPPGTSPAVDGIRVQAVALAVLALVASLATALVVTQGAGRLVSASNDDRSTWAALGLTSGRRTVAACVPAIVAGTAAALAAATLAGGLSGLLPTGLAGLVEPDAGIRIDPVVLGLGAIVLLLLPVAGAAANTWRDDRARSFRPASQARWIGRLSPTAPASIGLRAASVGLTPRSRTQARTAIVAVAAGVIGLTAVAVFGASQSHLFDTPSVQGFTWDVSMRPAPEGLEALRKVATASHDVEGLAQVGFSQLTVNRRGLEAFVIEAIRGDVHPTLIAGRPPAAADEIALPPTSTGLHATLGRFVEVKGPAGVMRMRVVGRAVYPGVGPIGDFNNAVSVTSSGARRLGLEVRPVDVTLLVRMTRGVSDKALVRAAGGDTEIVRTFQPPSLINLRRAGSTPTVLAAFLAALGAAGLLHALLMAMRTGRRDLGILQAIGFTRRQVRAVLTWQASLTVLAGLVIGVPLGVAVGRWTWISVATHLGVGLRSVVPLVALAAIAAGTVLVAMAAALVLGQLARRVATAVVLRAE